MKPTRIVFCFIFSAVLAATTCRADHAPADWNLAARQKFTSLALYDIVPYAPGREAETARDIRAVRAKTGMDTFLYSVSLDPRGVPAYDNVTAAMASFRKLKEEVKKTGGGEERSVKLGFLLQSILGHGNRVRIEREIEPWERSVDEDGSPVNFCVLDARFRDYIRRTGAAMAAERPCFILTDDDIRAAAGRLQCFCPLHAAEFNRRAGTDFSAEGYRAAVKTCREGDRVATICARLRDEIPLTVVRCLRAGIDSVDPSIPGGACMPFSERMLVAPRAKVMAGAGHPVTLRMANSFYHEMSPEDFVRCTLDTQALVDFYRGSVDRLLDESDTCPHTLYSRSGRTFAAKLAMGVFNGARGAKIWYVGMHKKTERVPDSHDRALAGTLPALETLAAALEGSVPLGVRIPAFCEHQPLRGKNSFFAESAWPGRILAAFGIPFHADFSHEAGDVVLLGGADVVRRLGDGDLGRILRGRAFVDGPAALALAVRGYAPLLGCRPEADAAFNEEVSSVNGEYLPITKTANVPKLADVAAGARILSELRYHVGAKTDAAGVGSLVCTNAEKGVVLSSAFDSAAHYTAQNLRRKTWLVGALRTLDASFPPVCENPEPNLTLARRGADGRVYVFTLNFSYDDIDALRYSAEASLTAVETLGPDGRWHRADATRANGVWSLSMRLPCMGFALVRFTD